MDSELIQALDRLRESVDALRGKIVDLTGPNAPRPGLAYLDDLREMRAKGLIDEKAFADKERAYLDKI
jgi:hypothetical protein